MSLFANALHRAGCGRRCIFYSSGDGDAGGDRAHKTSRCRSEPTVLDEDLPPQRSRRCVDLSLEVSADRVRFDEQDLHGR